MCACSTPKLIDSKPKQVWPTADASLATICRIPREKSGEHPRAYLTRLKIALIICELRRWGWERRDARLKRLITETPDGD